MLLQAVVHGDPAAVEPHVHAAQEKLASFDGLQHISQEERAQLFGNPALASVTPLPCVTPEREATVVELLRARAGQALLLQQALYCLKQLRTYQVRSCLQVCHHCSPIAALTRPRSNPDLTATVALRCPRSRRAPKSVSDANAQQHPTARFAASCLRAATLSAHPRHRVMQGHAPPQTRDSRSAGCCRC